MVIMIGLLVAGLVVIGFCMIGLYDETMIGLYDETDHQDRFSRIF